MFGIRSVNVRTLERPGFWRGEVVRYLVMVASFIVPLIGPLLVIALSPLFDPERRGRGWPDLAGATWFVDVRHGLDPVRREADAASPARRRRRTFRTSGPRCRRWRPPRHAETLRRAYIPVARSSGGVLGALVPIGPGRRGRGRGPRLAAASAAPPPPAARAPPVRPTAAPSPAPASAVAGEFPSARRRHRHCPAATPPG